MARAFVSIGSNIDPETNVRSALLGLRERARVLAISTVYRTEPWGPPGQPWFYNCVAEIESDLGPRELKFQVLRSIESSLGRLRSGDKFAARTIDLDLILYGELAMSSNDLTLPDPAILARPFLAVPLAELAPGLVLPGSEAPIAEAASTLPRTNMTALGSYTERLRKELFHERKQ